jgi:phosphatidylglycerophosphatase A
MPRGRYVFLRPSPGALPLSNIWVMIATVGGVGLWRWGPGTVASLVALPLAWFIVGAGQIYALSAAILVVTVAGVMAGNYIEYHGGGKDPGAVVIDEIAGQWLTLAMLVALAGVPEAVGPTGLAIAFIAFRIFDILKPWPCDWADRRLTGGIGIMTDDLIAGVYAGLALCIIYLIAPGTFETW